jgi:hypothetical protein
MNADWQAFLARQGLSAAGEHFADPAGELLAARDGSIVVPLLDHGLIRASGADAPTFLHNLLTNDVQNLAADGSRFAGMCTAKGRLLATLRLWREGDDYLLALAADIQAAILKKMSMYVLRSKVKLSDANEERVLLGLAGPAAPALLAAAGGRAIELGQDRYLLALAPDAAIAAWPALAAGATPAGVAAWRWREIAAGEPRVVAATQEAFVPQMVNMELPAVAGVSFTKGCYPGQEIVARTQYLGKIKRRMYRAALPRDFPPGTDVFTPESAGQHCGALVTTAPAPGGGDECLLVVQSSGAEAGEIHVGTADGPTVRLLPLPYAIA